MIAFCKGKVTHAIFLCVGNAIDDYAKGGPTQFWELFTMIPCAPKYLKR